MISLDEVQTSILELEQKDTCFSVCEKLADLYIVRDHLREYSPVADNKIQLKGASDFLQMVNGRNTDEVWKLIDELADTVKVLHPQVYAELMRRLSDI